MREALADLEKLIADNKQLFVDCKIKHDMPTGDVDRIKVESIVEIFDWAHKFLLGDEVSAWRLVKSHQPQANWDRYKLVGLRGTREQRLLRDATLAARDRWKNDGDSNRPSFPFNRHLEADETDTPDAEQSSSS